MSLRTKDKLIIGDLFSKYNSLCHGNDYQTFLLNHNKIISLKLFDDYHCDEIMEKSKKYELNNKNSYDKSVKESNQLCIIDEHLSSLIFQNIKSILIDEYNDIAPYGLSIIIYLNESIKSKHDVHTNNKCGTYEQYTMSDYFNSYEYPTIISKVVI